MIGIGIIFIGLKLCKPLFYVGHYILAGKITLNDCIEFLAPERGRMTCVNDLGAKPLQALKRVAVNLLVRMGMTVEQCAIINRIA